MTPNTLDLNEFRSSYARFLTGANEGRLLLTGHSHQAWPDVAREAMAASFDDAAEHADDVWSARIFPKIEAVGRGVLGRMGFDEHDAIAFGRSTHELAYRLLSCLRIADKPHIVATESEFHSLYRQISRIAEEGVPVTWVPSWPREGITDRILDAITKDTRLVAVSAVLFEDAYIVPRLGEIVARAADVGAILLIDAYHAFNVVPLELGPAGGTAFVTAGGYKYAAFGGGVCWLRIPPACELRPLYTGWFSDFASLGNKRSHAVAYGAGGARFAGATFDPAAFYRAHAALGHWDRFGLTPHALRAISTRQTERIVKQLDAEGLGDRIVSSRDPARRGGFVSVRCGAATDVEHALRADRVFVDARGDLVRLGPAPFLTDDEIDRGTSAVAKAILKPGA